MVKNKIGVILVAVFMCIISLNTSFATEIFDSKTSTDVYKVSGDNSEFNVPFTRISSERIEIDKSISQIGLFMSPKSIEVSAPLKGIQAFYSNDTVRVNSDTEYPVIFSSGNVVINGIVENTTFIYSQGTITINENADIKQNLICYAPKVEINSEITGNILGYTSSLNINNIVNGKIKMQAYEVNCSENAKVERGIEINTTNTALTISENVGESKIDIISTKEKFNIREYLLKIFTAALGNIVMFLLILIFVKKEGLDKMAEKLKDGKVVLKNGIISYFGLLAMICFGIVLLVLLTKLGVVLLIFSIAAMIIMTILKNVIFGTFVVELVNKRYEGAQTKPNSVLTAIMTLIIIELLESIPYVGELVKFVLFILSIGIIVSLFLKNKKSQNDEIKQEVIEAK